MFLPIAIAALVILLISVVWAVLPNDDSQGSANSTDDISEQEALDLPDSSDVDELGDVASSDDYVDGATDDTSVDLGNIDSDASSEYVPGVSGHGARDDSDDPWNSEIGTCAVNETGTPPHCVKPCPAGHVRTANGGCNKKVVTLPAEGGLVSSVIVGPADYILTTNTTVKNIPEGTNTSSNIYEKNKKIANVVMLRTYSNGKKFYLTRDQVDHGAKIGFPENTLKKAESSATVPYKMVVIIDENHSYDQATKYMPFVYNDLGKKYGYAANSWSITNADSWPNYIGLATGSHFGFNRELSDKDYKPLPGVVTVFGQAIALGQTAKVYSEGIPSACSNTLAGAYTPRHNPWPWIPGEAAECKKYNVSTSELEKDITNNTLPSISLVIPNNNHNGHNAPLQNADAWNQELIQGKLMKTKDWQEGKLVIVTTFDEDHTSNPAPGKILTTVAQRYISKKVASTRLDTYSITRSMAEIVGGVPPRNSATAPSLLSAFGLVNMIKSPTVKIVKREVFGPTTYVFTSDTTAKNVQPGSAAPTSAAVFKKGQKITFVEARTYSTGSKFYFTKKQIDDGAKTGFLAGTVKQDVVPVNTRGWKVTLPSKGGNGTSYGRGQGCAEEIKQPKLDQYLSAGGSKWFKKLTDGSLYFHVDTSITSCTTGGSKNVRSELREMTPDGSREYEWNAYTGTHRMIIRQKVTQMTSDALVVGQTHDKGDRLDDYTVWRIESGKLYLTEDGKKGKSFPFQLNKVFTVGFSFENGTVKALFDPNGGSRPPVVHSFRYPSGSSGVYFKAGNYCQCGTVVSGDGGKTTVVITGLGISHNGSWPSI